MAANAINLLKNHFIPHEGNNHYPYVLRHRSLFGYSIFMVALKVLVIFVSVAVPAALVFSSAITTENIIALTNETRSAVGAPAVSENTKLDSAAQAKANDIMANQYFAHTSPAGVTPWDWIHGAGYVYTLAGENLAVHYTTSEDVTQGWLASPTHRANLVNDRFSDIGIGIAHGTFEGFDSIVVVQMFGEPVPPPAPATPPPPVTPPVVAPTVEQPPPAPVEVPEAPATTEPGAPTIDENSLAITPSPDGYKVSLAVEDADQVQVKVGTQTQPLTQVEGVWSGSVPVDTAQINPGGEPLYVEAQSSTGAESAQPIAWVAPDAKTADMYAFSAKPEPEVKLFGLIDVQNLDNAAGRIYFLTIVFVGAALLLSLMVKFERHRHSTTAHALLVILIAGALAVL